MPSALKLLETSTHEHVAIFKDAELDLTAIIAIHDSTLGPALGGCRFKQYGTIDEALYDVLRLSEGMTYKNSLAGLDLGGGKSVILSTPKALAHRAEAFRCFGQFVLELGGRYITAEDMGTSVADIEQVQEVCPYVSGSAQERGGGGDPSPWTAQGVFGGIRACLERTFSSAEFKGRRVAIQGLGHVGYALAKLVHEAGGALVVSDVRADVVKQAVKEFGAEALDSDKILAAECDVLSPCAVGGIVNERSIPELRCRIVAGAANNQLEKESDELLLRERGIVYAPDFAINAGGVILCADEREPGGFTRARVAERVSRIYQTVGRILDEAARSGEPAGEVAVRHAKERIEEAKRR